MINCIGSEFSCFSNSDCTTSPNNYCCLTNAQDAAPGGCPRSFMAGSHSDCVALGGCNYPDARRICYSDNDCPAGAYCREAEVNSNSGFTFGVCEM